MGALSDSVGRMTAPDHGTAAPGAAQLVPDFPITPPGFKPFEPPPALALPITSFQREGGLSPWRVFHIEKIAQWLCIEASRATSALPSRPQIRVDATWRRKQ